MQKPTKQKASRGYPAVQTLTAGTADSEGLGHRTGVIANSPVTSTLTCYLKGGTFA